MKNIKDQVNNDAPNYKNPGLVKMGHDATKPVFGVSDKASFKAVFSGTETS